MIQEFKPTIFFLLKFLGLYLVGNLLYGMWVTGFYPSPDPMTNWVTVHSAEVLTWFGWDVSVMDRVNKPTTYILLNNSKAILSVFEGCNGLNVMIVFASFMFAFGPINKKLSWFMPLGLLIIHISNIIRIVLLFLVSVKMPDYLYFTHKYLFTAFIYFFVFMLWIWWVARLAKSKTIVDAN